MLIWIEFSIFCNFSYVIDGSNSKRRGKIHQFPDLQAAMLKVYWLWRIVFSNLGKHVSSQTSQSWCSCSCSFCHGAIIRTGITCKKIFLLKMLKWFEVMLNMFEFSLVKEIFIIVIGLCNKFSWIIQPRFLTEIIK